MLMTKNKSKNYKRLALVLLDRDGVLCDNGLNGIHSMSEFRLVSGLSAVMRKLGKDAFRIGVITNQPDISRGTLTKTMLGRMNNKITEIVTKAGIKKEYFTINSCPHTNEDNCSCRKPRTGLIKRTMEHFGLQPEGLRFYMVGDKLVDMQTMENYYEKFLKPRGIRRNCVTTILLRWKYAERNKEKRLYTVNNAKVKPDIEVKSLDSAINLILNMESKAELLT